MSPRQFYGLLKTAGSGATIDVDGGLIQTNVIIDNTSFNASWLSIRSATFEENLEISNVHLGIGILFENCVFKKAVRFENITANGRDDAFLRDSKSVIFKKCAFDGRFTFLKSTIERDLSFEDCEINKGLYIEHLTIKIQAIYFNKCKIKEWFDLNHANLKMGITINDCEVDTRVRFFLGDINSIAIINSKFQKDIYIEGSNVNQNISFNGGEFQENITLKELSGIPSLTVAGGKYQESFSVTYNDTVSAQGQGIKKYYLRSCEFVNGFYVNGVQSMFKQPPLIDSIELPISTKLIGDINFRDLDVGVLTITGFNSKANLFFARIFLNQMKIKGFINNSQLIFSNLKASFSDWHDPENKNSKRGNAIYLDDSNLGQAQFFQTNFDSFPRVLIHNVILSEIRTSNVTWFDPLKLRLVEDDTYLKEAEKENPNPSVIKTLVSDYKSRREIFRQLKYAMNSQGDIPQALEFRRWEMDYFRKYLELQPESLWEDKFILWTNLSNKFGQSWLTALGWGGVFTFVLYIPIALISSTKIDCFSIAGPSDDITMTFKEIFWNQLGLFPQLLNPAHYLKNIIPHLDNIPKCIHFFDFFHRIVTAYFLFQIVSAFRKYVK